MGVAVRSGVAAAIRPVVSRVVTHPEVFPVAIRPVVSPVVTGAVEAADKDQSKRALRRGPFDPLFFPPCSYFLRA
jgi:hypothetical protein